VSESNQLCPFCDRKPGERHNPLCTRSDERSRLLTLSIYANEKARRIPIKPMRSKAQKREYALKAAAQRDRVQGAPPETAPVEIAVIPAPFYLAENVGSPTQEPT